MKALSRGRYTAWTMAAVVVAIAVGCSLVGLRNGFVYDDRYIIVHNPTIDRLGTWWRYFGESYWPRGLGGDGYRPLTILAFAIEWAIGGGSAIPFHAVNIVLYALTTAGVFWIAVQILPRGYAFVVAALFAVHPVHVEAVANIVGQSELWVALLAVVSIALFLRWRIAGVFDWKRQCALGLLFVIACFFKEHAIVIPALLLAAEVIAVPIGVKKLDPLGKRLVSLRPFALGLAAVAIAYVGVRFNVLSLGLAGFQQYVPFQMLHTTWSGRVLTMLGLVPEWLRLLLWPARLSTEYGPPTHPIVDGFEPAQLPGVLLIVGLFGLAIATRKREPVITFGIVWFVIALLPSSNFIIPSGILIAERTLFLPSVGAMLAIGAALPPILARLRHPAAGPAIGGVLAALLVAGFVRTYTRTRVWFSNDTLFEQTVKDSPLVYRTHYMLGAWHFYERRKREGEAEYRIALRLFPREPYIAYNLGDQYRESGMLPQAVEAYKLALSIAPEFKNAMEWIAVCEAAQGASASDRAGQLSHFAAARDAAYQALEVGSRNPKKMITIIRDAAAAERGPDPFAPADTTTTHQPGVRVRL